MTNYLALNPVDDWADDDWDEPDMWDDEPVYPRNRDAGEAMQLAHQLRQEEGLSMGDALEEAWAQIRGEVNPDDDEGIEPSVLVLAAVGGVVLWRVIKGTWPWESPAMSRRLMGARPSPINRPPAPTPGGVGRPVVQPATQEPLDIIVSVH